MELHREGPAPAACAAGLFYLWMASSISLTNTDKFVRSCFSFFFLVLKHTKKTNLDNTVYKKTKIFSDKGEKGGLINSDLSE